jgi:hypothetical protein
VIRELHSLFNYLIICFLTGLPPCDELEPNDILEKATNITFGMELESMLCPMDLDVFRFQLGDITRGVITLDITSNNPGNLVDSSIISKNFLRFSVHDDDHLDNGRTPTISH